MLYCMRVQVCHNNPINMYNSNAPVKKKVAKEKKALRFRWHLHIHIQHCPSVHWTKTMNNSVSDCMEETHPQTHSLPRGKQSIPAPAAGAALILHHVTLHLTPGATMTGWVTQVSGNLGVIQPEKMTSLQGTMTRECQDSMWQ